MTWWKPVCVVSSLLAVLAGVFMLSRSPGPLPAARMHQLLNAIALRDAELTHDVLLARAGLLSNYDSLTHGGQALRTTLQALDRESEAASGDTARDVRHRVDALADALEEKLILVEYFKSDNALVRNSSTNFSRAGQGFGGRGRAGNPKLAAEIIALAQAMLRFTQSPEAATGQEVRRALDHLSQAPTRSADGEAMAQHGRVILATLPRVDALVRLIVAEPISVRAGAIQDAVLRHSDRMEAQARVFRILLAVVGAILLGYALYQFGRRRGQMRDRRRAVVDSEGGTAGRRHTAAMGEASATVMPALDDFRARALNRRRVRGPSTSPRRGSG
jgi:hypothetical protein